MEQVVNAAGIKFTISVNSTFETSINLMEQGELVGTNSTGSARYKFRIVGIDQCNQAVYQKEQNHLSVTEKESMTEAMEHLHSVVIPEIQTEIANRNRLSE